MTLHHSTYSETVLVVVVINVLSGVSNMLASFQMHWKAFKDCSRHTILRRSLKVHRTAAKSHQCHLSQVRRHCSSLPEFHKNTKQRSEHVSLRPCFIPWDHLWTSSATNLSHKIGMCGHELSMQPRRDARDRQAKY